MDKDCFDRLATMVGAGNRRAVLRGFLGSALAASALAPEQPGQKAVAREGAGGGRLGGRHGKNRRGRDRHRSHGDKKQDRKKKPHGGQGFGSVTLTVNNLSAMALNVVFWTVAANDTDPSTCEVGSPILLASNSSLEYVPKYYDVYVWINERYYIGLDFPTFGGPRANIAHDGDFAEHYCTYVPGVYDARRYPLDQGETLERTIDGHVFEIIAKENIGRNKFYALNVRS